MYKNGYVMGIVVNGQVVEEDSSKRVCLPFGQEYSVKLINKNYEQCAADLIINGEQIARFIVGAGETIDIERYLDENLNSGKRFKFISLNDSQVKDKKDIDNGIAEAHFYRENKKQDPIIIREEHHYHHHDHYPYIPDPYPPRPWRPWGPQWSEKYYCDGNTGSMTFSNSKSASIPCNRVALNCSQVTGLDGATVRGSESKQEFKEVSGYEFESTATILKLKIVNGELAVSVRYCGKCGRKHRDGEKFCPNCGNKLI